MKKILSYTFTIIVITAIVLMADQKYYVQSIIDGDTIVVQYNKKTEQVKFIGIDAPEVKYLGFPLQYCGKEAFEFTEKLLKGKLVRLEFEPEERDENGRLQAYVYVTVTEKDKSGKKVDREVFVNAELLENGLAQIAMTARIDKHRQDLFDTQMTARKNRVGIWGYLGAYMKVRTCENIELDKMFINYECFSDTDCGGKSSFYDEVKCEEVFIHGGKLIPGNHCVETLYD